MVPKHLKAKIRPEEQHKVNSPWNIAAEFKVDMSFSADDVTGMLADYEADHSTGMDVAAVTQEIADWTGGYPFLVSRLCQLMDEEGMPWNHDGVGRLDMRAVLEGFRRAYVEVFGPPEDGERFCEDEGRKQFLLFLKPIINGTGNYYVEAQTRDRTRTDVVVDYAGERFVVELKIWKGPRYNEEGERQVAGYLERFGLDVGYMLSFCFNRHKEPGLRRVPIGERLLWEEVV